MMELDLQEKIKTLAGTQSALLNIIEDFNAEDAKRSETQRAILNILEDFDADRGSMATMQRATFNILEDFDTERNNLKETQSAVLNILEDIEVERKTALDNVHLAAALKEKELLLGEIHHRVKNNLQIIDSLLGLQSAQIADPMTLSILRDSQNRVKSMAAIHQILYESRDFARVNFTQVLDNLTSGLMISYGIDSARIRLRLDAQAILFSMDIAIPLGLMVNELISNALKHAFPEGRSGEIAVLLVAEANGDVELTVSDDGIGIPAGLNIDTSPTLGLQLVRLLSEQVHGTLTIERAQPTRFTLRLRTCSNSQ